MPSYRHHDHGNLYVQFDVKFPTNLTSPDGSLMTEEQRAALETVLPPRNAQTTPPADAMTEDYQIEEVDTTREAARANGAAGDEDDDEEGGHPGAERVQCASQ